ncbi:hypothetical protein C1H46_033713 [Malus baccata]|uniref:Zinc knuckle CX2CX4HX4C domain-containing protein n=1 Tax=Malus baccata TaxID=106549 RepID=A0A540L2M9_MALBA|nr:hypothetical protein C1H46_033713 [Malus baccata]
MTRQMGKLIGNILGVYVLLDQSKKEFQFGSILRIRVRLDVGKPLRRWVSVQLDEKVVHVDIRYEKLPLTCFLCGMMDHVKEQCEKFNGQNDDDRAKPHERWFQDDVLGKDYRKPQGKKFGLDSEVGWSMKVPDSKDGDECMREVKVGTENGGTDRRVAQPRERDGSQILWVPMDSFGKLGQSLRVIDEHVLMRIIPDLNEIAHDDEMIDTSMAIIPFVENNDVIMGQREMRNGALIDNTDRESYECLTCCYVENYEKGKGAVGTQLVGERVQIILDEVRDLKLFTRHECLEHIGEHFQPLMGGLENERPSVVSPVQPTLTRFGPSTELGKESYFTNRVGCSAAYI